MQWYGGVIGVKRGWTRGLSGTTPDRVGYGTRENCRIFMQIISDFVPEQCVRVNSNSPTKKIESYSKMSDNTNSCQIDDIASGTGTRV
jgi:hypothetical protein